MGTISDNRIRENLGGQYFLEAVRTPLLKMAMGRESGPRTVKLLLIATFLDV
jgi:hypothetical protein